MKIHILGASGSGTTTLGMALAKQLAVPYFDADSYFWVPSDPPFTVKRDRELRNSSIFADLAQHESWVLGGSLISWHENFLTLFDLVVFLYVPKEIRMERLEKREFERYGDIIYKNPARNVLYNEFMHWAAGYDDNTLARRTLLAHETWMKKLSCPVLDIRGDTSINERIKLVLNKMWKINNDESHKNH